MADDLRKSGISTVGDVPWGTHFCYFYETKQDLLDILVPYFKSGLENNEFCLWIISNSELIDRQEASDVLEQAVPDLDRYLTEGGIELVSHDDWFLEGGTFDFRRTAKRFKEKLDEARAHGYVGMRVNGSPAWICSRDPEELRQFEEEVDGLFSNERIIASCTYPVGEIAAVFLFDVARSHQFTIARRQGRWEVLETPQLIRAKREIEKLNEELEQRVKDRTQELAAAIEELKGQITERKRAEEQLRLAEEQARKVLDTIPALIASRLSDGTLDYCNQQWLAFAGLTLKELQSGAWKHLVHPDDKDRVVKIWQESVATGKPYEMEERHRRFDGMYRWFLARAVPLKDKEGRIERWYGTLTDIDDLKHAEEALRESQHLLQLVLSTLPVGVSVTNREGDIVLINSASERIWGGVITSGRQRWVQTRGFWHDSGEPIAPKAWASVRALSEGQTSLTELIDVETYDGQQKIMENSAAPIRNGDGAIVGAVIVNQDVTDRVRAEEQLRMTSERLRALSDRAQMAKEEEATRISREIHDELGSALTSLKWDLEEFGEFFKTPRDSAQFDDARKKIEAMIALADTTLNTVRRLASELRPAVLELGLAEAIEWQAVQFQERTGIDVQFECSVEKINLNPEQLTAVFRILQEALTNILRHAQATMVVIKAWEEPQEFVLTIKDNGKGFTDGKKLDEQSLGILGMRERAHLIGGEIHIKSAELQGTRVTLRIPIPLKAG